MSVIDDYEWPSMFPNSVPPKEALPAAGHVYRAVKNVPPDESDFPSTREEHPDRDYSSKEGMCRSYGVSFFEKIDVLLDKVRRYKALQNRTIVHGDLVSDLGVVSKTNRHGHVTLWKCIGSKPHEIINTPVGESS